MPPIFPFGDGWNPTHKNGDFDRMVEMALGLKMGADGPLVAKFFSERFDMASTRLKKSYPHI